MPRGHKGAEALPSGAPEGERDGAIRQARAAVAPRDLGAEHGPDGTMDVADGTLELDPPPFGDRRATSLDQLAVQRTVETVVLVARPVERGRHRGV